MGKACIVLVISIVFLLIAKIAYPSKNTQEMIQAEGVIERVTYSETGNVMYYVSFWDGEKQVTAQSIYYTAVSPELAKGATIPISYFYSAGKPWVHINDDRLTACTESTKGYSIFFFVCGIALLLLSIYLFIKSLL